MFKGNGSSTVKKQEGEMCSWKCRLGQIRSLGKMKKKQAQTNISKVFQIKATKIYVLFVE